MRIIIVAAISFVLALLVLSLLHATITPWVVVIVAILISTGAFAAWVFELKRSRWRSRR